MIGTLKEHGPQILHAIAEPKTAVAAAITTGSATVAKTVETTHAMSWNEISLACAAFGGFGTGLFMLTSVVLRIIEIRKAIKEEKDA